jgi:hypothetical protein
MIECNLMPKTRSKTVLLSFEKDLDLNLNLIPGFLGYWVLDSGTSESPDRTLVRVQDAFNARTGQSAPAHSILEFGRGIYIS